MEKKAAQSTSYCQSPRLISPGAPVLCQLTPTTISRASSVSPSPHAVKGSCPRDVVRGPSPCVSPLKEFACPPIEEGIKVPRRSA